MPSCHGKFVKLAVVLYIVQPFVITERAFTRGAKVYFTP